MYRVAPFVRKDKELSVAALALFQCICWGEWAAFVFGLDAPFVRVDNEPPKAVLSGVMRSGPPVTRGRPPLGTQTAEAAC